MASHREALEDLRNSAEGQDFASCPPHRKHLAALAAEASDQGLSADTLAFFDPGRHRTGGRGRCSTLRRVACVNPAFGPGRPDECCTHRPISRAASASHLGSLAGMLGLPPGVRACLFDLDGVLTKTATVHAAAWQEAFDAYLRERDERTGDDFVAFDVDADYDRYVDGRSRADGTRSFLKSRGIVLPEGGSDDPPDAETVHGVGNRKNEILLRRIKDDGVEAYDGSVRYVRAAKQAGLRRAVVSSSANCREVLVAVGIENLFEERIDGVTAGRRQLAGKPAPDTFLAAAEALGVQPREAVVFEDALAGVEAGRAGKFGFVVGVDRAGQADALLAHGADLVVGDLADLLERG
jgi:beta-phosphoglucomutase family hydrolase